MKKLLLILLCLPLLFTSCKKEDDTPTNNTGNTSIYTYVPDDHFEAYLENNGMGDGIPLNDSVFTSAIDTVTYLDIEITNTSNLTGIEDFTALIQLWCGANQLTSLDVSQNIALTTLSCGANQLTSLDVSQNTNLTYLECALNQITSLDISQNTALAVLTCFENNLISLTLNNNLYELDCRSNQLIELDLSNNTNLTHLECGDNPDLTCIHVDDAVWSTANLSIYIDPQQYFSETCP